MNELQRLKGILKTALPAADLHLDAPVDPNGNWLLDVWLNDHHAAVEWYPNKNDGFGVSFKVEPFSGPDEIIPCLAGTVKRLVRHFSAQETA